MRTLFFGLLSGAQLLSAPLHAQAPAGPAPRVDERVAQIPQSAPGTPWAFIGYGVNTPKSSEWFVTSGTPRGGTLGRHLSTTEPHSAILVLQGEALQQPIESDAALLALTRDRHAKLGERWTLQRHDETIVRHAGTRCARHVIDAREPEDLTPRKDAAKANAERASLHVTGLSCVHPNDPTALIEVGVSERSRLSAMSPTIQRDAEEVIGSLSFQRYTEQSLQTAAKAARAGLSDAEDVLKPYIVANAAWARYFMAQILERAQPAPADLGSKLKALLEPAADRGLADAQWALARLYLKGAPDVPKDPTLAEALLRRAAERGNPGAAFQLGLSLLSGADGITRNDREALLWVQRAAFRGQKEAQDLLAGARDSGKDAAKR
jgi:hypothetical protein